MSPKKRRNRDSEAERAARREVVETALAMSRRGLSPGRSGNVSRRWRNGMLITPSGMAYDGMGAEDIAFVGSVGGGPRAAGRPSSEWRFHLAAYAVRPDMHAVVHTHSLHAVALACAHKPIPAFHYMVAIAGSDVIPCVPYATFGSEELAAHVAGGLKHCNACLMANHGQIAVGETLAAALELAAEVETLAAQYCKVLALGKPHLLDGEQMAEVLARFKTYGQRAQD